ncbi:MAG: DUF4422 domain-containing protein [Eubacteriales bacterium]|nr:DUF4422 domain-containing protein [Eubacteriales bacterium]MDY3332829.1 DUF4422 domain-containing protein [Gallibacter sp.]
MKSIIAAMYMINEFRKDEPLKSEDSQLIQNLILLAEATSLTFNGKSLIDDDILVFEDGICIPEIEEKFTKVQTGHYDYDLILSLISEKDLEMLEKAYNVFKGEKSTHINMLIMQLPTIKKYLKDIQLYSLSETMETVYVSRKELAAGSDVLKRLYGMVETSQKKDMRPVTVNNITFYYDSTQITLDEKMVNDLKMFARQAQGNNYTIYVEDDHFIIF